MTVEEVRICRECKQPTTGRLVCDKCGAIKP